MDTTPETKAARARRLTLDVRRLADEATEAAAERNRLLAELVEAGWSGPQIAEAAGLSVSGVWQGVRKGDKAMREEYLKLKYGEGMGLGLRSPELGVTATDHP